ncbi:hypothetical protein M0R45_005434 [Rubus argutus]|uniref:Uncharacterized protein n=1 Tax=Rubus argutus TaxID=59490 RepID=A0AAW1YMR7_RUBAR
MTRSMMVNCALLGRLPSAVPSIELLKESPPALRTCARLALLQPFVGRELFAAGFVSCWALLNETSQKQLVRSLEMAFSSPNIPPEILATLLNLDLMWQEQIVVEVNAALDINSSLLRVEAVAGIAASTAVNMAWDFPAGLVAVSCLQRGRGEAEVSTGLLGV